MVPSRSSIVMTGDPEQDEVKKFLEMSREAMDQFRRFCYIVNDYVSMDVAAIILCAVENLREIVAFIDRTWTKYTQESLKNEGAYRWHKWLGEYSIKLA